MVPSSGPISSDDHRPTVLLLTVCSGPPPTGGLAAALCSGFVTELMREGHVVGEEY